MNLFDLYENREPYQQAIDKLEARRIEDLEAKMDDYARRGMKDEFQKCKAERDGYYKVKNTSVDEAGIGQDLVTPQQRVQQATPQKQTPIQKVGSTVKHAANWLAGRGGPGKEGPTYEEAELDEQEAGPFDVVAGKNLVLLQQAWEKQLPNVSLEFPGQNLTVYLPQVYSIFKHLEKMNNNKQVATVQKFFGDRQDFLLWMNSIKQLQIPPKAQKAIKSQFAQPEPGQLDLGIAEAKKKDSLSTPGDPESEVAIKLARSRHPTAKSDLSALVKDKIATDKTVKKEIDQVKTDNERQEKEIQSLEKETDALIIATRTARKPKNFDTDGDPTTPLPPSAGAFVPAAITPPVTTATKPAVATPADATTRITPKSRQIRLAEPPMLPPKKSPDFEPTVSKGKEVKDKSDTTKMNYRSVPQGRLGRTQRPALAGVAQQPSKNMGGVNIVPQVTDQGLASSGDTAQSAQDASRGNRQQRFAKPKSVSITPNNWEVLPRLEEGQMNELDIARQDLELMSERQFYVAYGMSKAAFQQQYRALLNPAEPGYTNESVDDDDWDEDEGDFVNDPTVHAQVRKQPLPDSVLRAIERDPGMRADIIAAYKRKHGIAEGPDLINMSDLQFYKELLAVLVIPIAGLGAAAWHRAQNALKLYRAEDVITALNKKGITVDRATLVQIKPLLLKLEQAIDVDRDGDAAKELAQRIQQTVTWGKLKQAPTQPATPAHGGDENGVTEAIPVIRGTQPTGAQYSTQLAKIAMKLAKQRHADGLRNDAKDFNKAAKLFAAGDVDGGAEIIAYEMDTEPADEFYAYMEHYKIPTEIVFGLTEAGSPAQQAAIAIAMKRAGKKPKHVDEAGDRVDPILYKALDRMQPGIAGQGQPGDDLFSAARTALATEWGLSALRSEYATATAYTRQLIDLYLAKHGAKQGMAEDTGSWIVYDPETKQIKKRFKTHTAGKSYAKVHGLGFASSEYYFDNVKEKAVAEGAAIAYIVDIESEYGDKGDIRVKAKDPQDAIRKVKAKFKDGEYAVWPTGVRRAEAVDEAQTDYQKRRQRERDVDAGKPVSKPRQPKMTDYQKRRAQDRKDMELGEEGMFSPLEESYTKVMESQGITDPKLLEVARRIDAFAKTIK